MVYYNATITFYGPQTSPTAIFTSLTVAILARSRHWHFYRQSGMCSGIIYPFYTHITVRACTYMFMLEFQLVIPYHNRHTHCPRLSPYVMSDLEMVYMLTASSAGCRLGQRLRRWHAISLCCVRVYVFTLPLSLYLYTPVLPVYAL